MAEKQEKKAEAAAEGEADAKKKGGLLTKMPVLLGGTIVIEAVLIIGVVKVLGIGAKPAQAVEVTEGEKTTTEKVEGGEGGEKKEGKAEEGKAEEGKEKKEAEKGGEGEKKAEGGKEEKSGEKGEAKAVSKSPFAEIELASFRAPNAQSGRRIVYDISIYARVKRADEGKLKGLVRDRKATVEDRIRTIVASLEPEKLGGGSEPGLETFRRQVKYSLEEISGEKFIEEVLVPRCLPYRGE